MQTANHGHPTPDEAEWLLSAFVRQYNRSDNRGDERDHDREHDWDLPDHVRALGELLDQASAPGNPDELAGEEEVVTAFRAVYANAATRHLSIAYLWPTGTVRWLVVLRVAVCVGRRAHRRHGPGRTGPRRAAPGRGSDQAAP
ncbi:hypothetical protein GCM10022255_094650 [Dactylosporangium darangshiense]|uniref:Uncharacterized protein n=1 Tax=Dactylosporangium darangshiense TaxID=579108 RepID=A0ABP8DQ53_9ACTN